MKTLMTKMQQPIREVGVLLLAFCLSAGDLPSPGFTPGTVRNLTKQQVCSQKWTLHALNRFGDERPSLLSLKKQVAKLYGVPWSNHASYQFDHLVPRCLGGADVVSNIWPQPLDSARKKDRLEKATCKMVCAGGMGIEEARNGFRRDWTRLNRQMKKE